VELGIYDNNSNSINNSFNDNSNHINNTSRHHLHLRIIMVAMIIYS
jgi:hypothetical protein